MKSKIRPIYQELMGYLSQAPANTTTRIYDTSLEAPLHNCMDQLVLITGQDLSRFNITVYRNNGTPYIKTIELRSKLNGLIMNLHAQFFNDESSPFGGSPSTIITQTQSQQQSAQVVILLEFQSLIYEKLNKVQDEKEKGFLESVKSKLVGVKNVAELVTLLITTAKTFGITVDQLVNIFS